MDSGMHIWELDLCPIGSIIVFCLLVGVDGGGGGGVGVELQGYKKITLCATYAPFSY